MNLAKGFIAGVVGAIVATKVKSALEEVLPVREEDTDSPPVVLVDKASEIVTGTGLAEYQKEPAEKKVHWLFGLITGGLYGVAVEKDPTAAKGLGSKMGTALYGGTHASILPALDTEPWPTENKNSFVINEFVGHIAFGVTTELIRRQVRKLLG